MKFSLLYLLCTATVLASANEALSGGHTTTTVTGANAFSMPAANLPMMNRLDFSVGNSFFRNPWVTAPASTDARDGLGPLFNANGCQNCHIKDGRGHPPLNADDDAVSMLIRLSIPNLAHGNLTQTGVVPEPNYGGQLQDQAIPGAKPEARIAIEWQYSKIALADGTQVELRAPQINLENLAYGPMHEQVMMSMRIAPPMIGLGLLENLSEDSILANADPDDADGDGISGRANWVWDIAEQRTALGRFGWKAGQPSLSQQNASAFAGDIGITSQLKPATDCTPSQHCQRFANGGEFEAEQNTLKFVDFYTRHLAVPKRRNIDTRAVQYGKTIFNSIECAACHVSGQTTALNQDLPALSQQRIYPYTDMLLHDMGEGLADHRPEFAASGSEWRTPPLWGLGYTEEVGGQAFYLHDGRARTLEEAILWHGGEALTSRNAYMALPSAQRAALIKFLESL